MSSHLLIEATSRIAALLMAVAIAAKALASVLRTWIEQASRTRRLSKSLKGAKPRQRPGIILACGQLERKSTGGPDGDKPDNAIPAGGHQRPPVLIMESNRGHECQETDHA